MFGVAGAGAGKTCFARTLVHQALSRDASAVYFPCGKYTDSSIDLRVAISEYMADLVSDLNLKQAASFVDSAELIVIDACDECSFFGEELGRKIKQFLVKKNEFKVKFKLEVPDAMPDLPDDFRDYLEFKRSGVHGELRLLSPLSEQDYSFLEKLVLRET